jgi:hypothetical protein
MIDYIVILSRRYGNKEWTLNGNEYAGLTWLSESEKPAKSVLDGLWTEVQEEIAAEAAAKTTARQALLERLGITEEEAQLLLGGI